MKKNILILSLTLKKGGSERVISLISKYLANDENINFHILLIEGGIEYELPECVKIVNLKQFNRSGVMKFFKIPFLAYKLLKYIQKNKIDIVMSFLYRPNYINILSKIFGSNHKSIINIRSTTSRYKNEGLLGKVNLFLVKLLFNKANLIISNSKGVDDDLKSIVNITTKTTVINNPVDLEYIKNKKIILEDKHFLFEKEKKYIISVGRLISLKRNGDLLDAFFTLQNDDNKLEIIFLGDGILKNDLKNKCELLKIKDKVHFLGNVKNPFYYLNKSNLFVMTSETEGFPNVLVEAMACGIPVVSSDCKSGPREILKNETYGLLYPVGNIDKLIEKIKYYLYEDIDKNILKMNNIKRIDDFNIKKIMKKFILSIEELY